MREGRGDREGECRHVSLEGKRRGEGRSRKERIARAGEDRVLSENKIRALAIL